MGRNYFKGRDAYVDGLPVIAVSPDESKAIESASTFTYARSSRCVVRWNEQHRIYVILDTGERSGKLSARRGSWGIMEISKDLEDSRCPR